tara:strand:+ start:163 stop:480 length:318 start_codon:yes stop_codon:yes gene_type:complete
MGDVYYCETNQYIRIKIGKTTPYKNQKFKFKRTSEGLIFGSNKNYFRNIKLTSRNFDGGTEFFSYKNDVSRIGSTIILLYNKGNFYVSHVSTEDVTSMTGTCSIF